MACVPALGFNRDCSDSVGGISELYLTARSNVSAYVEASHEITGMTDGGANWYRYDLKKEVGSVTAPTTISPENGTRFTESTVAFSINKFSATKSNEMKLMILGQLAVIVKDENGVYWGLGFQSWAEGSAMSAMTGTAFGDRNGYDISILAKEKETPYEVAASVIAGMTILP
jgi:hypothetical protein